MSSFTIRKADCLWLFDNLSIVQEINLSTNQLLFKADFIFCYDNSFESILFFLENLKTNVLSVKKSNGYPYLNFIKRKRYCFEE